MSATVISKYFPNLTEEQQQQFSKLEALYNEWNSQINVISRKDIDELYVRHVLHSLGIAKIYQFTKGQKVLDVGTGGGFPGIPLAIMFPDTEFHLVDSIQKKIKVVADVAQQLGLENVKTSHERAEKLKGKYDFVVSRAVTRITPFYHWIRRKIQPTPKYQKFKNGILALKGGNLSEEMAELKKKNTIFNLADYFDEEFFETKKVVYIPIS